MAQFDLPPEELRRYRYHREEPAGLDAFWRRTLDDARSHPIAVETSPVSTPLRTLEVQDVSFAGFGGERIKGWLLRPSGVTEDLPVAVEYIGYGGGRGRPYERLLWASAGFAHLVMDTRGQGGMWNVADTPDPHGSGPSYPGFATKGIESVDTYYYRRLYTDAVRAVEAVYSLPGTDPSRIVVTGSSQGGALSLAAAALSTFTPFGVAGVATQAAFMCALGRGIAITDNEPYSEIARYLGVQHGREEEFLSVLDHFDNAFLASRITAPAWFSVGLMDPVCPPSTTFAAINALRASSKTEVEPEVVVRPYNDHQTGGIDDDHDSIVWAQALVSGQSSVHRAPVH